MQVTIVAKNPETLDGLQEYLRAAGIDVRGTRVLESAIALASPVFVLFPDDFDRAVVLSVLATLRVNQPDTLRVLVTSEPRTFERLASVEGSGLVVVPKPAWGWTILDAVRARLEPPDTR